MVSKKDNTTLATVTGLCCIGILILVVIGSLLPDSTDTGDNITFNVDKGNETIKEEVSSLFNTIAEQIKTTGFSALYTISIFVNNLIVVVLFGLIGGLIGVKIINSRSQNNPNQ